MLIMANQYAANRGRRQRSIKAKTSRLVSLFGIKEWGIPNLANIENPTEKKHLQ